MYDKFANCLNTLNEAGNLRHIRKDLSNSNLLDLSSNDYLGIASDESLMNEFLACKELNSCCMTSSASRLLSIKQNSYDELEKFLASTYKKEALLFNSGFHANTGIIPAICDKSTLVLCDKLVHASIINGIILSGSKFIRFKHNDMNHLQSLVEKYHNDYPTILVITESVFSMDGDICDLQHLVSIKRKYKNTLLYVDEAHGFGVFGNQGLGVCEQENLINDIDIIIATLGKAAASVGAFAITNSLLKDFLINTARSFIFSTMLPPINCEWSLTTIKKILSMNDERKHLINMSNTINTFIQSKGYTTDSHSQIIPIIIGDSHKTIDISRKLLKLGYIALPIRTPTVPPGTERIRISLNAGIKAHQIEHLIHDLDTIL